MDLNEVRIIGTVIKDPEVTTTKSGYTVYTFVISYDINKQVAGNWTKQSTYYEVKQINAPNCTIPCKAIKGAKFLIVGKIAQQQWEKDGKKRIKNYIMSEAMFEIAKKRQLHSNPQQIRQIRQIRHRQMLQIKFLQHHHAQRRQKTLTKYHFNFKHNATGKQKRGKNTPRTCLLHKVV